MTDSKPKTLIDVYREQAAYARSNGMTITVNGRRVPVVGNGNYEISQGENVVSLNGAKAANFEALVKELWKDHPDLELSDALYAVAGHLINSGS